VKAAEDKLGNSGRVLLRKSGTEPVLRVMSEALAHDACLDAVDSIIDAMRKKNLIVS
jgi:phosphoglucosamine mutase